MDTSRTGKEKEFLESTARYLSALAGIQDRLFQVFGAEGGEGHTTHKSCHESSTMEGHTTLFRDFADCFEKNPLPSVSSIYSQWTHLISTVHTTYKSFHEFGTMEGHTTLFRDFVYCFKNPLPSVSSIYSKWTHLGSTVSISLRPNLKDAMLRRQLECAKVMAGLLILNGHYLEAMRCLHNKVPCPDSFTRICASTSGADVLCHVFKGMGMVTEKPNEPKSSRGEQQFEECPLCLGPFLPMQPVVVLECPPVVHRYHIYPCWLAYSGNVMPHRGDIVVCPMCRVRRSVLEPL